MLLFLVEKSPQAPSLLKFLDSNIPVGPNMAQIIKPDVGRRGFRAGRVNPAAAPLSLPSDGKRRGWFLAAVVPTEGWHAESTNGLADCSTKLAATAMLAVSVLFLRVV